jgi:predicted dehydrogenase
MMDKRLNRRDFLAKSGLAAAATGATLSAASYAKAAGANGKIGIGVIGCGGRSGAHINTIKKLIKDGEKIEIVAVCDVYKPRANQKADGTSARVYMDHKELLADPAVDVVVIATPDHHHPFQAIDAMEAGKDVYCEKPISHWRQFEITKKMAQVAHKTKRIFQAGTQGLGDPVWRQAEQLVRDGAIGRPVHAQCGYFRVGDWGERGMPIDDKNAQPGPDLNWEKFLGDSPKRDFDISRFFRWRMYEDYAGGPSTDLFPHTLTPIVKVLGVKFPSVVVATGGMFRYSEREVPTRSTR